MHEPQTPIPKVSILIPVYNREALIGECIQSALEQSFTDFEVVLVDNASTDGTWQVCRQFAEKDQRIRVFRNETNIGPVRNWLACLAQARGEYTKILWSDDLIHPEFLGKLLPYLEDKEVGFVYSATDIFESNRFESIARYFRNAATGIYDSSIYVEGALLGGDFPGSPGCAIFRTADVRKNLLLHVPNCVNSDFSMHAIGNDLLLFLLTAAGYPKFAFVNETLSYFRSHPTSISTSSAKGKIPLHYDLAKGFFAESHVKDKMLKRKLNVEFFIHFHVYEAGQFGIRSLNDFYPSSKREGLDFVYLGKRISGILRNKIGAILSVRS